jgi:hypothetical protein
LNSDTDGPTIIFYTALINTIQINHSQHTLAMWWNLKFFRPELKPNKHINDNDKEQKLGYDFLPRPKPNSELLLIELPSATLVQKQC